MHTPLRHLLFLLLTATLAVPALRAQTPPSEPPSNVVTTHLDTVDVADGVTSLREALLHLNAGLIPDTILFSLPAGSPLTITLTSNLPSLDSLTCHINGSNRGPDGGLVTLHGGDTCKLLVTNGTRLTVDSLTLSHGRNANPGGALYAYASTVTLRHCRFLHNHATHSGGALYCGASTLTLIGCILQSNTSVNGGAIVVEYCDTVRIATTTFIGNSTLTNGFDSRGGALRIISTPCLIDSCRFLNNRATVADPDIVTLRKCYGGAVSAQQSYISIRNTTFSDNLAEAPASGVAARAGALHANETDLTLHNCAFLNDTAVGDGGAIYIEGTVSHIAAITRCTFSGCNALTALGGAVANYSASRLIVDHCTLFSNCSGMGGALYTRNGDITLLNSTLVSNHATENNGGGAIMAQGGLLQLCNNLFADNTATTTVNDIASWPRATLKAYHNLWYSVIGTPTTSLDNTTLAPTVPLPLHLDAHNHPAPAHTTLHNVTHTLLPPLPNTAAHHSGVPTALSPDFITAAYLDGTTWRSLADNLPLAVPLQRDSLDQIGTLRPSDSLAFGAIQPLPAVLLRDTLPACDSLQWRNTLLTPPGLHTDTLPNPLLWDTIYLLTLNLNYSNTGIETQTACEEYTWHGATYTASTNNPTYNEQNAAGCDSVVTLNLTVNYGTHNSFSQSACDVYTWHGVDYTESGVYTYGYTNADGCASADTLHLDVSAHDATAYHITACDQYHWNGVTYTASGVYTYDHSQPGSSCTDVDTLYLTINYSNTGVESQTVCDHFAWHGTTYTSSTTEPQYTETNAAGCDSVVTLHLTVKYSNTGVESHTACDFFAWHGITYTASTTTPTYTDQNVDGCDSVVSLHLTINRSNTGVDSQTACDRYTWHGQTFTSSTHTPTFTEQNAAGCDSVVTLHLTVNYSNTGTENQTVCDQYTWHGTTYTASTATPTFTETNAVGCDSVVTLHLTVNYSNTGIDAQTACDEYTWHGTAYTATTATPT